MSVLLFINILNNLKKTKKIFKNILAAYLLFLLNFSFAQDEGNYFINNYSSTVYKGAIQNFDIIQDDFGLLYFANNSFILEYNGKSWLRIHLTDGSKTPTSFARGNNGVIYVGGENEIGFLERDVKGKTIYRSLNHLLKQEEKDFTKVWYTLINNEDVFFCSNERIIRYSKGKIKSWKPKNSFHKAHIINNILFVREVDRGLMFLKNDEFEMIEKTEVFADADSKIAFLLPYKNNNEFLIFTRSHGIFHFDINPRDIKKSLLTKYKGNAYLDTLLKYEPYDGLIAKNNNIIIGTIDNGIFVFDKNYHLLKTISTKNGLINNECRRLFIDNQNNLWIAFNNGISKVEINSPLRKWDKYNQIEGLVTSFVKYKNNKYIATSKGLMIYDEHKSVFNYIKFIPERCLALEVIKDRLYIATERGLYTFDGKTYNLLYEENTVNTIKYTEAHPKLIFCGTDNGIAVIGALSQKYLYEIKSPLNSPVLYMAFLDETRLLASTRSEGIFCADLLTNKPFILPNKKFYKATTDNFLFDYNNNVYIGTDSGLYSINKRLNFVSEKYINKLLRGKYSVINAAFSGTDLFLSLSHLKGNDIGKEENVAFSIKKNSTPAQIYFNLSKTGDMASRHMYFDSNKVFISNDEGVFILDKENSFLNSQLKSYLSLIIHNTDTLLYNLQKNNDSLSFQYGSNKFAFEFGSNDFSDESKLMFQYYLEGYESDFNKWTEKNKAYYENIKLKEGDYAFHLKAKNIFGHESDELVFNFKILAPWYRTLPAYILYFIVTLCLIFFIVKLNAKRLVAQNKRLEKIIVDRTQTITIQKTEIEHKNKEITDSINYAQKIQLALMASLKLLDKNLILKSADNCVLPKDYFLLYNPKDIVSGDFYWATELKINDQKQFVIVISDCTGHGVPGAFMSLLCIGFLNEITKEKEISDPGQIFNELRSRIVSTLNPEGSETERKDGMDAILLNINYSNNIMSYAAANNSFYVLRDNNLLVLKADKMPVGKYSEGSEKSFTTSTFELREGDVVYTFTDGYADQFGGPKGKKFKYKQLEDILIEIHKLSASDQKKILIQKFKDWQGNEEQVDDVLIFAIKF